MIDFKWEDSQLVFDAFWSRVAVQMDVRPCWEWKARRNSAGYGVFSYAKQTEPAHKFSLAHFGEGRWGGGVPSVRAYRRSKPMALHSCDNPACVNPRHLRYGDAWDNSRDRDVRQTMLVAAAQILGLPVPSRSNFPADHRGEKHHRAKITEVTALAILAEFKAGESVRVIAQRHNVSDANVSGIGRGRIWKHI